MFKIVVSEELANPQPDLSLSPILEVLCSNILEVGSSKLDDALNEQIILFFAPVMPLLNIEVFQVQTPVTETNLIVAQSLSHVHDVLHLLLIKLVVN